MKRYFLALIACSSLLFSCSTSFDEKHEAIFDDQIWTKGEEVTFLPLIHEATQAKKIELDVQHIYGYDIAGFDLKMKITAPSGTEILAQDYFIKIKGDDGKVLSQCSGDYCDLTQVLESNYTFPENGEYTITLEQNTHAESVAGFLSVRLKIKDAEAPKAD